MNKHTHSHVHTYTTTHCFSPPPSLPGETSDSSQHTDNFRPEAVCLWNSLPGSLIHCHGSLLSPGLSSLWYVGFKALNSTFQSGRDKYQRIGIPDFPFQCEKVLDMEILPRFLRGYTVRNSSQTWVYYMDEIRSHPLQQSIRISPCFAVINIFLKRMHLWSIC